MSRYRDCIETRFGGVLRAGSHRPDGHACALEAASIAKGIPWTSDPEMVGLPDLRALNDARWSNDAVRTAGMVPVIEAYWDWSTWSETRRREVIDRVLVATVREIIADLPRLPDPVRVQCQAVTTREEALAALTRVAIIYAEAEKRYKAFNVPNFSITAGLAAALAALAAECTTNADAVLQHACRVWLAAV